MVAQMALNVPTDDSRPGLPGDLEVLGRLVERHFEGSINFLASHIDLGRAATLIGTVGLNWANYVTMEALLEAAKSIESKSSKLVTPPAAAKPAPLPTPEPEEVAEPVIRFTPGLVLEKDGVNHVVCQGKFGACLRLVPMSEARVALNLNTIMRALNVRRLEEVNSFDLLKKSFCPKCAETVLPTGSQTVPEALAAIDKVFADEKAVEEKKKTDEEARLQRESEERVDARIKECEAEERAPKAGREIAHALGLFRPARRDKVSGKLVAGISDAEYRELGKAAMFIRASGITAADVRSIGKNWVVSGVIKMAKDKLSAIVS